MRTVGPGEYATPPELTGSAIEFVGMSPAAPVPAGVTQIFRFKGVALGQTIVRFHNTDPLHADVRDTIIVR